MSLALAAADAEDWVTARKAAEASGPLAEALVDWRALRSGHGDFKDYLAFVQENPDWPGLSTLREWGERKLPPTLSESEIRAWLGEGLPTTWRSEQAYLRTLSEAEAKAERKRFWLSIPLEPADEAEMLAEYPAELKPLIAQRASNMLDEQNWRQAERLIAMLPETQRPLLAARIALQAGRSGVDDLILALPESQLGDAGLTMDRFLWRVRAKHHQGAQELMLAASVSAETLRVPDLWAQMRVDYTRLAMRNDDWALALKLASPHYLAPENRHYTDLEWLAGYAALKTGAPDLALKHFQHLETVVGSAISKARAFYWQGRAFEALQDAAAAQHAYGQAAAWPAVYYGQLAAEKTGAVLPAEYAVTGAALETLPDWRGSTLRENIVFRAGLWLVAIGRVDDAQRFFLHLAETSTPEDIGRMARVMLEAGAPWHGLRLSKRAADLGVIYPAAHFPLTGLEQSETKVPIAMVLSITRQESEFNYRVVSYANAHGLMQLLPGTASDMARKLGIAFDAARLTTDPAYNVRLGAAYLQGLWERFGASSALIASGYNAGPGRPARWLVDFGDLRRDVDPVDWVELIPFDETRNYVMRVTEALPIYRSRLKGTPAPIVPSWDLSGGGLMPPPALRMTLALSARPPGLPVFGPYLPAAKITPPSPADATE